MPAHRFCVAPMLDWTNRHCRFFHRQLTARSLLYTEMITTGALLHGDLERHLRFAPAEHPLALQLGGNSPKALAHCARLASDWGYDEINFNVGCPSDRVQNGAFGACLMANPSLVSDCVKAMTDVVDLPISVKHRIGIDHQDSQTALLDFVGTVAAAGCRIFIVHARKAWLEGLSPKENRDIPPLDYARVYALKQDFPALEIIINGGITTLDEAETHLAHVDGVMLGRAVYQTPWLLADVDRRFFGSVNPLRQPHEVITQMQDYIEQHLQDGGRLSQVTRHMLGLFQGLPGARQWRRLLSEQAHLPEADTQVLLQAAAAVRATPA